MSSARRVSKRRQNGGSASITSKRPRTQRIDSVFTRSLETAGILLSDGISKNVMRVEVPEFRKALCAMLTSHQQLDYDEFVDGFIEGLGEYIENLSRLHKLLIDTSTSGEVRGGGVNFPSVVRLLLCIDELQSRVATIVIEKLLEFTEEPPITSGLDVRDLRQIPKLILNQFRWLDYLVNGKDLCDKLFEVVTILPVDLQRDAIQALPHIIEDDQHAYVAEKLKSTCESNSELLTACIDTWSELNMETELGVEILEIVMERVSSADVTDLPMVINYVLNQSLTSKNVTEVIREVRDNLDTDSCFIPIPSMTSTPHPHLASQSVCSSGGYVVLDCIQSSLERLKVVANGWLKVIDSIEDEEEHKLLDLFVLFILHGISCFSKTIRTTIINKVKSKKLTENILSQFFQHKIPNLKNLFPSVLSVAEHLLCSSSPTVSSFAKNLYKHAFAASDIFKQQSIIGTLVALISSGDTSESNSALDTLESLAEGYNKEVERHTVLVQSILDYLEYLSIPQIRKVYSILSMLGYRDDGEGGDGGDSGLHDELESIIRKQLHHSDEKYRHIGVIAAVMVVKQIAQQRSRIDGTLLDMLNEEEEKGNGLSSRRQQQAQDVLKQVFTTVSKDHSTASLFFDEMANVVETNKIHNGILNFILEEVTGRFQDNYVVEDSEDIASGCGIPVQFLYSLDSANDEDGGISINLFPCVVQSVYAAKQEKPSSIPRVETLCSHFRLLRVLEQAANDSLLEVDALLGCSVVLADPGELEADKFKELTLEQRQILCAVLFHCINWFRELLSAFAGEKEPEMKGKALMRLDSITELQQKLNTCLMDTAGPIPTVVTTTGSEHNMVDKPVKKRTASKSKADATLATTIMSATQLENGMMKDTTTMALEKSFQVTTQSDALQRLKPYFRELDLSAYFSLGYEPLSRSVLDTNMQTRESEELELQFPHLLFLLQELYQKVSTQFSFFAAKKKSGEKQSSWAGSKDSQLASMMTGTIIPALCNRLESINTYFQVHVEANDGVLDCSLTSPNYHVILTCFQLIFKTLTAFFNWPLLADPSCDAMLKQGLRTFSSKISHASSQEESDITFLSKKTFRYLEKFTDVIPNLIPAVALCRLLVAIQKVTKVKEIKIKTADYCGNLLKRSWSDTDSSGSLVNEALEYLIKYHIEWSEDPLETIEEIYSNAIPDLMGEESREHSQTYPTLTIQSFPCYYRSLSAAVVSCVKSITPPTKDDPPTAQVLLKSFQCLAVSTKIYHVLVNLVKSFDLKGVIAASLKYGRHFVEAFIKNGIPIVDLLFRIRKDDVMSLIKTLQQATRCLQHFCGYSKVLKDITLTNHVPNLKKCLEMLIFRIKEVLINHNCAEAFWMGSLKNRDLQGQVIPSQQVSDQSVSYKDDDKMETEEEDTNSNDRASHVSTTETNDSIMISDED